MKDIETIIKALDQLADDAEGELKAKLHLAASVLRDCLKLFPEGK